MGRRPADHGSTVRLERRERNEARADMEGPAQRLFLSGDFTAAASIPIGATLPHLEREHKLLPAVFYALFVHDLCRWMRVYDCRDALEHAEMAMIDIDEEQLQDSCYPQVKAYVPRVPQPALENEPC